MACLIVVLSTILYFALFRSAPLPYHPAVDGLNDVLLHVGAFGILTVVTLMIWHISPRLAGTLILFGILIELAQLVSPTRQADGGDIVANVVGIVLGHAMFIAMRWLSSGKIDSFASERK